MIVSVNDPVKITIIANTENDVMIVAKIVKIVKAVNDVMIAKIVKIVKAVNDVMIAKTEMAEKVVNDVMIAKTVKAVKVVKVVMIVKTEMTENDVIVKTAKTEMTVMIVDRARDQINLHLKKKTMDYHQGLRNF